MLAQLLVRSLPALVRPPVAVAAARTSFPAMAVRSLQHRAASHPLSALLPPVRSSGAAKMLSSGPDRTVHAQAAARAHFGAWTPGLMTNHRAHFLSDAGCGNLHREDHQGT